MYNFWRVLNGKFYLIKHNLINFRQVRIHKYKKKKKEKITRYR